MSLKPLLAASAIMFVASCASDPDVHEQAHTKRETGIIATSGCATMFSYAAQFAAAREKESYLAKFRYMMDYVFSDLGATVPETVKGSRLTMERIILPRILDGGFIYNNAMATCESLYQEYVKARQPSTVQIATTDLSGAQVFELVSHSVWTLISFDMRFGTPDWDSAAQGSAVAVNRNSLLTNCHTLRGHSNHMIVQPNRSYILVEVASTDNLTDRCVLKTSNEILDRYVEVRSNTSIDVGEEAYTIGAPSGLELTMANGIVSGKRIIKGVPHLQTSAPISKGSSGGGLFDRRGRLMGITTFYLDGGQNLNFAIAADQF